VLGDQTVALYLVEIPVERAKTFRVQSARCRYKEGAGQPISLQNGCVAARGKPGET
jgi:hypothetical protein